MVKCSKKVGRLCVVLVFLLSAATETFAIDWGGKPALQGTTQGGSSSQAPLAWPYPFAVPTGGKAAAGFLVSQPGKILVQLNWEGAPLTVTLTDPTGKMEKQVAVQKGPVLKVEHSAARIGVWIVSIIGPAPDQGRPLAGAQPAVVAQGQIIVNYPPAEVKQPQAAVVPVTPAPSGPSLMPAAPSGSVCEMEFVLPASAEVNDEVVITGKGLSVKCSVYFQNGGEQMAAVGTQAIDVTRLKVRVPVMVSGKGSVTMRPDGARMERAGSAVKTLPFEIRPSVPILQSINAPSSVPTQKITVTGSNMRPGEPWAAYFVSKTGKRVPAPVEFVNATTFRVIVPDMDKSTGTQDSPQNGNRFYVTRGAAASNYLPFEVLPMPECYIRGISVAQGGPAWPGKTLNITGDNFTGNCMATFSAPSGQDFTSPISIVDRQVWGGSSQTQKYIEVTLPDMPSGNVKVFTGPKDKPKGGAPVSMEVAYTLQAKRVDIAQPVFGTAIWSSGQGERIYTSVSASNTKKKCAYGSCSYDTTPLNSADYTCGFNWTVYQKGDVYTYVYDTSVQRGYYAGFGAPWPDLDLSVLALGLVQSRSKWTPQNEPYELNGISHRIEKGEIRFNAASNMYTIASIYVQSKRPPVPGQVTVEGSIGSINDNHNADRWQCRPETMIPKI